MRESRIAMLQMMPIFGGVSASTLDYLLENATIIDANRGDYFFQEDDLDNSIYILELGRVAIFRSWKSELYMLRELGAGDCFGEMALMDCKPRSAAVRALEACRAIRITAAQLAELYEVDHQQYLLIYMNLGREVCRRLNDADSRLLQDRFSFEASGKAKPDHAQRNQQKC
ncbi:MAG: cyclic nucleotide-binding domain-containing protein [Candidatus Thiodiazotropha sp.]|jgi:CRP/FNR family transcriptional regulator, cyclic AMP receptor protein